MQKKIIIKKNFTTEDTEIHREKTYKLVSGYFIFSLCGEKSSSQKKNFTTEDTEIHREKTYKLVSGSFIFSLCGLCGAKKNNHKKEFYHRGHRDTQRKNI